VGGQQIKTDKVMMFDLTIITSDLQQHSHPSKSPTLAAVSCTQKLTCSQRKDGAIMSGQQ